jgi:two-component system phosphate regulon sensor histidine kinase PhoR
MHIARHSLLISLLLSAGLGLVLGAVLGYPLAGVTLGLMVFAVIQIRRFNVLRAWLVGDTTREPPELPGAWGEILDALARMQKRTQAREASLRSIISRFQQSSAALPDAVVIIDRNNNLEWWNLAAERLLGLRHTTDRGKPLLNLLRDPVFVDYYRKGRYQEPLERPSPLGGDTRLQYQISLFGADDRLLVARDITRLTQLEQTRQNFVANASHELRTPLTVIRGYLETFLDQDLPKPLMRGMSQMQQQAQRMENLVQDLLLLSRLEATSRQATAFKPVLIQSLISHIHEDAVTLSGERQHQFELQIDPQHDLLGVPAELQSALSNLVFNAVRYTPDKGRILIRWWADAKGGHFSVTDSGIGIEARHIPHLTERFYRVDDSRSSASGGTGLGLAIVKHVLMRLGARLEIESKPGKGSCFSCHFPIELVVPPRG